MAYKRADRVNALLQRELGTLISEELSDPRIAFTTVTSVEVTDDLRSARVFVSVLGDDELALRRSLIAEKLGRDSEALAHAQNAAEASQVHHGAGPASGRCSILEGWPRVTAS